ncbi:MarR family transcriptional regulator [Streptomyces sp. NBC_01622]|uniref:MarR family winged helix-turn-helix transcriptional regulator n=1 Tax=Streptomyces sp. NBC_01622 TaxID=2975903 RepID=UPI003864424A|nr:MarR family transcriptional regulator [Streptomyces sp. NBC_01622]
MHSERLLAYIKRAEQATQQAKEYVMRETGITPAQQTALAVLCDHDGITAAELARRCAVTPQTMNSTVGRLEARDLVRRTPHPVHGTLIEIRLTGRGREVFHRADTEVATLDSVLGSGLTPEELDTLKELLARVSQTAARVTAPVSRA